MKNSKTILTVTLLLAIFLFVLGKVFFVQIFEFFEPKIEGITFEIIEHNRTLKTSLLLSLILAFIPISISLTWRIASITSLFKKLIAIVISLLFISIGIWLRHQGIKSFFTRSVKNIVSSNGNRSVTYPLDPVAYVYYMLIGLIVGCITTYILFRKRTVSN
jgi:hypothetical protein